MSRESDLYHKTKSTVQLVSFADIKKFMYNPFFGKAKSAKIYHSLLRWLKIANFAQNLVPQINQYYGNL